MRLGTVASILWLTTAYEAEGLCAPEPPPARAALQAPIRGITIGPIENAYHPGLGYGSEAFKRSVREAKAMGATWISLTPFGRVGSLSGLGVSLTFETPFPANRENVMQAIRDVHAEGLSVMLVPHLWVESGEWRALIDPKTDAGWKTWSASYRQFVLAWASAARESGADMLSVGVELRSWVTSARAPSFLAIIEDIRKVYPGPLTYSANWDDAEDTIIWGAVDRIGINAFYPLAQKEGDTLPALLEGGERVRERVEALQNTWQKPVFFTEMGYTTRADPALKPWEWPDAMKNVHVDQAAQADAYAGLLFPMLNMSSFGGFFVWRTYADPDDVSQESEWGFSPRGKRAECTLRSAFAFGRRALSSRCVPGLF